MARLRDRVAIVTGAGQGVGRGVARAFAKEGARVVIANRTRETGELVAAEIERDFSNEGGRARWIETDVSAESSVRGLVDEAVSTFGRVDILVNNATPVGGGAPVDRLTNETVERYMAVNFHGAFWAMQAVFPHMKRAAWGRILCMASLSGINAHANSTMYNASKEALRALTRTAAGEWARYGITANVICPFAATPAWEGFQKHMPNDAKAILGMNPSGRPGDAETDIGPLAVFLASDDARYVTGNTIHADGGGHISGTPWGVDLPE